MAVGVGVLSLAAGQVVYRAAAATPPTAATPTAASDVPPGTAAADAALIGIVPQASSLSLTTSAGQSESAYNQNEDQATSATVDLGGLGVLLANSPVCGQVFFTEQRQPQPLTADSQDGSRTENADTAATAGQETVTVSKSPEFAQATTAPVNQSIPGVLAVTGQTRTEVRYIAGQAQEAEASVHADVTLLGGLVSMSNLVWQASRETGAVNSSSSSFSFGSVRLAAAGVPVTLPSSDSVAQVLQAVNSVLSTFGLTVLPPTSSTDDRTGTLTISPLDLHFSGSPTDNKVLGPAAAQLPALENALAAQATNGSDCSQIKNLLGNLLTPTVEVANVGLAGAQGSGGLDVDLGGASVSTQAAPAYSNPFDVGSGAPATPLPPSLATGTTAGGTVPTVSSTSDAGPPPTASTSRAAPAPAAANGHSPLASLEPTVLVRCVTTSPAGGPGCWAGLGTVAGAAALGVGVLLLAADLGLTGNLIRHRPRRSRRRRLGAGP